MHNKGIPDEYPITLVLNGFEVAVFQLTKLDLEDWAYGYLYSEGFIQTTEDIGSVLIRDDIGRIDVVLTNKFNIDQWFGKKKHYTAGCGRGVTFFSMTDVKNFTPVHSTTNYALSYLLKKQSEFAQNSPLYLKTGGMHGACIVDEYGLITVREDIGRHNAVDKIIGYALRNHLNPNGLILLTTGRVSYEMLSKAAKFGFAVIGSRTAATRQALQLAHFLNIEVVGYLRGKKAVVYTSTDRVQDDLKEKFA
ncbi:formate dehydrogenase accessory sulfurtransferase FdhD [Neobacillus sp. PS3-40]|uniref:formate dehydrogenase accessory sulfurtransferase FdhD n=1 Tax=Neobacillus sp. PS3-40 TaxID=3070679 RepID=UPI0027DF9245|nr:formate dehydrogenase accessory sulfurtransferase FdhD [Neobacillus sp. PS3-40]WML42806.1 formate dehydrogenase accessory sulfurtransferase FdhD [Neobacillus sp. PS3-40]